ncbi:MAG: DUF2971 domain-containing protein [Roseburia sp.]|nr:DUF2971 domain-containing protein [Anaeroplasma bactoclasticum]MCM1196813.1 DUF2971 domain-containing protein [Roseburia sp.]MCM1556949.1 DUF2971 domain-containing protein [Anaeroplasma bactoclasticum]
MYEDIICFYDDFFHNKGDLNLKKDFIKKFLSDCKIYKFIPFDEDIKLNNSKIFALKNNKMWVSCIHSFDDKSEFECNIDYPKAESDLRKIGIHVSAKELSSFMKTIKELHDVTSFTISITEEMWKEYGNNHNGICLEFSLINCEKFYPIIYLDKENFDYTDLLVKAQEILKNVNDYNCLKSYDFLKFSHLLYILKDKKDYGFESELRYLGDPYDDDTKALEPYIYAGKKEEIAYKGHLEDYNQCGIKIERVIVGSNISKSILEQLQELNEINITFE